MINFPTGDNPDEEENKDGDDGEPEGEHGYSIAPNVIIIVEQG